MIYGIISSAFNANLWNPPKPSTTQSRDLQHANRVYHANNQWTSACCLIIECNRFVAIRQGRIFLVAFSLSMPLRPMQYIACHCLPLGRHSHRSRTRILFNLNCWSTRIVRGKLARIRTRRRFYWEVCLCQAFDACSRYELLRPWTADVLQCFSQQVSSTV